MHNQVTRNNHYVPVWYQRGFLEPGQSQLHYLVLLCYESPRFHAASATRTPSKSPGDCSRQAEAAGGDRCGLMPLHWSQPRAGGSRWVGEAL